MSTNKFILAFATLMLAVSAVNAQKAAPKSAAAKPKITNLSRVNVPSEKAFQPKEVGVQLPAAKSFVAVKYKTIPSPGVVVVPTTIKPIPEIGRAHV